MVCEDCPCDIQTYDETIHKIGEEDALRSSGCLFLFITIPQMEGWIKLHRQIMEWERYCVPNMLGFWIHILLKCNHKEKKRRGISIKKGQFVSSLDSLVSETGLSKQTIRTLINKLKSTNEITYKSTHSYTLFTIVKYSDYQDKQERINTETNIEDSIPPTHDQHTTNTPLTPTNNDNNIQELEEGKEEQENNTDLSSTNGEAERDQKIITKQINELIELIKKTAFENGLAYIKDSERNFAKHILTAKEYGQFCEAIGMSREQFAIATMLVSVKIKYFKGPATGPKKIYQNYAEIYNKGKVEFQSNAVTDLSIYLPSDQ